MKLTRFDWSLIIVLLFGFFLRNFDLTGESIWLDEEFSLEMARLSLAQTLSTTINDNPPLFNLTLHFWLRLFGETEFSIRFLSVVFGVLGMVMIYKLGHLMFNKEVGIVSAIILGVSVFHIFYSQEARMYILMALLTLFSFYFLIKLQKQNNLSVTVAYILSSCLLMYTHLYTNFIIVTQNVYIFSLYFFSDKSTRPNLKK